MCLAAIIWATLPGVCAAQGTAPEANTDGKISLDLRYRFEYVDEDGFDNTARASLLRSRITMLSPEISGFSAGLEIDDVSNIGVDDYNSTENGKPEFPTIADPEGTTVNQAFLRFRTANANATAGRQRILLGDMRFIGAKPWRNNEQTYDGVRLQWQGGDTLSLDGSYVNRVSRAFGPDDGANPAEWKGDSVFLRGKYSFSGEHSLAAFSYRLDVEAQADFSAGKTVNNSSDSLGLEYRGAFSGVNIRGAVATQEDAGASELNYRASYYVVEFAAPWRGLEFKGAHEVLGADNGVGFATPLANGHRYQGWADKFLNTPGDGLEDTWLSVDGKISNVALTASYHDFRAESSSLTFGRELDFQAQWTVSKRLTATLKAAFFDSKAADRYPDTTKAWLMLQYRL